MIRIKGVAATMQQRQNGSVGLQEFTSGSQNCAQVVPKQKVNGLISRVQLLNCRHRITVDLSLSHSFDFELDEHINLQLAVSTPSSLSGRIDDSDLTTSC